MVVENGVLTLIQLAAGRINSSAELNSKLLQSSTSTKRKTISVNRSINQPQTPGPKGVSDSAWQRQEPKTIIKDDSS